MKRGLMLVIVFLMILVAIVPVGAQTIEPDPVPYSTNTPYPLVSLTPRPVATVMIVGANQVLPPDEAIPVVVLEDLQAQGVFDDIADDLAMDVDWSIVITAVIVVLGLVLSVFGGLLAVQGRQLRDSMPPWLAEIILNTGDSGLASLGKVVAGTATEIDNKALAEIIAWWNQFRTPVDVGDVVAHSAIGSVDKTDQSHG